MTLKELADDHGLPVTVVSKYPHFGGDIFTLLYEDQDARRFLYVRSDGFLGWMIYRELLDTWVVCPETVL